MCVYIYNKFRVKCLCFGAILGSCILYFEAEDLKRNSSIYLILLEFKNISLYFVYCSALYSWNFTSLKYFVAFFEGGVFVESFLRYTDFNREQHNSPEFCWCSLTHTCRLDLYFGSQNFPSLWYWQMLIYSLLYIIKIFKSCCFGTLLTFIYIVNHLGNLYKTTLFLADTAAFFFNFLL